MAPRPRWRRPPLATRHCHESLIAPGLTSPPRPSRPPRALLGTKGKSQDEMDFQSAMETFAEAWVAANAKGGALDVPQVGNR